jgi:hypothetical protein
MNLARSLLLAATAGLALAACSKPEPARVDAAPTPVAAPAGKQKQLTENWVRAFVEREEAAQIAQDMGAISATLADEFTVTRIMPKPVGDVPAKQTLSREQALQELRDAKSRGGSRTYAYEIGAIRIADDGLAAWADVKVDEKVSGNGHQMHATSDQVYEIDLRDGEPKIVSATVNATSLIIDGKPQF